MSVEWLDVDYTAADRPTASCAPAGWGTICSVLESLDQAEELFVGEITGQQVTVARRGCSILRFGSEAVRQDLPNEAGAHAEYARLRAEVSGLMVHRLQAAGAGLAAARVGERAAMVALSEVARAAVAEGMGKVSVARHSGIARVTLYAMLRRKA